MADPGRPEHLPAGAPGLRRRPAQSGDVNHALDGSRSHRPAPGLVTHGRPFDPERVAADIALGDVEIWRFAGDLHHPVHLHLNPFQVLSRRGGAPGPHDLGWKDTVVREEPTTQLFKTFARPSRDDRPSTNASGPPSTIADRYPSPDPTPRKVSLVVRPLFVIAVAVLLGFVLSPRLRADAACTPSPAASATTPALNDWSDEQVANARIIITIGNQRRVPNRGQVIAVATALQESGLRNLRGGDRDSIGLFQQRPSQGWGTPRQLSNPAYQAQRFYDKLLTIDGWQNMRLTDAAQAVQVSAYPEAYAKRTRAATRLVDAMRRPASCTSKV